MKPFLTSSYQNAINTKVKEKMTEKTIFEEKASCIVNPRAARNKWERRKRLRRYLTRNIPSEIIDIKGGKEKTIETARKKSLDHNIIIAVGGDGTIADVIQGIIESGRSKDILFGIIPFGSGNAFRKSLGIPKSSKKALKSLYHSQAKEIDLIDVEGKKAGFASVGAIAQVTQEKLKHKIPGLLGHLLATRIIFSLPRKNKEIELIQGFTDEGEPFERKILNTRFFDCVVGKTSYFGYSWKVAPRAKLDDGFLDITLFETTGFKYILHFPLIYFGLYQKRFKHFKAKKVVIRGQELFVQYNGEFLGVRDRVEIKVLPQALKVIYP